MDARELTGALVDGRYLVVRRIARGGMATVYEARDTRLDRHVALKVMHPHLAENPEFVQRFVGEARAAARLSHPNVVAVHDQGTDGDDVYLVMELVDGITLRDLLQARGRLTPTETLDLLEPVLAALAAAHQAGLVHRDVKPENVLITPQGRVTVADFGLARATTTTTNATQGVLIGTVAYLSPEQVEHGTADVRSDVYGAGVMLFEMLTGHPPFDGDTPIRVAYRHVEEDVPPPSAFVPDLPRALDALVAGATARDPERRYRDGDGFLRAAHATRARLGLAPAGGAPYVAPPPPTHDTLVVASPIAAAPPRVSHDTGVLTDAPSDQFTDDAGGDDRDRPAPATPRRRRGRGLIALMLVLALAAVVGGVAWRIGATPTVDVPAVVGKTADVARADLAAAGLASTNGKAVFSETVKSGLVVTTSPAPGASVAENSTVTLVLSKGPERYAVPNIVKQTKTDATNALEKANLAVGETSTAYSGSIAKGLVISSDPKAGTKLKKNTTVAFVVSKGPKPIAVPNVKGQTVDAARATISDRGLTSTVTEKYSATVASGRVIDQSPSSGTLMPRGTITLTVSKGPAPVPVPNVENRNLTEATSILQAAGFTVRVRANIPGGPNIVLQQSPNGGELRPKGTQITLDVF
jgi:serine/threonine-protein kinase